MNLPTNDVMERMKIVGDERQMSAKSSPHGHGVTDSISGTQIRLLVSVLTPSSVWENEEDEGENGRTE